MGFLLDTSAVSAYLSDKHRLHSPATKHIDALPDGAPKLVSIVTLAELEFGIRLAEYAGSAHLSEYRRRLAVIRKYTPLDISHHTGEAYADLKIRLAKVVIRRPGKKMPRWIEDWVLVGSGKNLQIDENDLWIAAQAKERDLTVVSTDTDMRVLGNVDSEVRVSLISP